MKDPRTDLLEAEKHLRLLMNEMKAQGVALPSIKVHAHNLMNVITSLVKSCCNADTTDDLDTGGSESNFR